MTKEKIPKVLHYCWFGGNPKSELINRCITSWKRKLPDYEIIEWNETNFDVNMIEYTKQAYNEKKYAFVSDFARLWIIYNHGGIYVDTDVEIIKRLDCFLEDSTFMAFEGNHGVNPGLIFGSVKNNPVIGEIMSIYRESTFINPDQSINLTTIVKNTTDVLIKHGLVLNCNLLQKVEGIKIYPTEYFCPDEKTRESKSYGTNTYTVHHYDASWMTSSHKKRMRNPVWRVAIKIIAKIAVIFKSIIGQKRWEYLRNKYFIKAYNFLRGQ